MTVTNQTSVTLEILGGKLKPNESRDYVEMMLTHCTSFLKLVAASSQLNMASVASKTTASWLLKKEARRMNMV